MTLQEIFNRQNTLAQATSTGMNSLKEYLSSVREKMMSWSSDEDTSSDTIAIAVTTIADENVKKMVDIPRSVYQQCVDDIDGEAIALYTSEGVAENFSRVEIMSAVEDVMGESGAQLEFIDYVMNHAAVSATEFTTYIKSKYSAVSNQLVDKYGRYLSSGNPIHALTSYLSSINLANSSKGANNEYISISSRSQFTGTSVWSIVWTDFKNKVSELFQDVWEGIQHIWRFFKNLFAQIVELGKWLLTKIAKPLTTNYEKAGSNFGIMDLPLLQYKIGHLQVSTRGNNVIEPSDTWGAATSMGRLFFRNIQDLSTGGYARITDERSNTKYYVYHEADSEYTGGASLDFTKMLKQFAEALVDYDDDGEAFVRPFDVAIPIVDLIDWSAANYPAKIDSIVLRLGVDESLNVYLQLFVSMPKAFYDSYYDIEIAKTLACVNIALIHFGEIAFPYSFWPSYDSFTVDNVNYYGGNIAIQYPAILVDGNWSAGESSSTGPIDLVQHLPAFNFEDILNDTTQPYISSINPSNWTIAMIGSRLMSCVILPLLFMNCPHLNYTCNNVHDVEKVIGLYKDGSQTYGGKYSWTAVPPASIDGIGLPSLWLTDYRPYCNSAIIDASVHYQTLAERASELEKYIIAAIIAVAAIIVTVQMVKFSKKRAIKLDLAQSYADNMAWNLPANPTSAQISEYTKARRKARRIAKHNALLGIGSNYTTNDSIITTIQTINDQLFATQGYSDDQTTKAPTLRDIKRLVCGVE